MLRDTRFRIMRAALLAALALAGAPLASDAAQADRAILFIAHQPFIREFAAI